MKRLLILLVWLLISGMEARAQSIPTLTPTPTPNTSQIIVPEAILRGGPGRQYPYVGALAQGRLVVPLSRNEAGDWVLVRYYRSFGWLQRDLAYWLEDVDALPVLSEDNLTPSPIPGRVSATPFFPTETPTGSWVWTTARSVYVRGGPGRTYLRLADLPPGTIVEPAARNADSSWVMIRLGEGFGWVAYETVRWAIDIAALPVVSSDNLTPSPTFTATRTPSATPTATATATASATLTPTRTPTPSDTPSLTATATLTATLTPTNTPTSTATATLTKTPTATPTQTPTTAPTATVMPSVTPTPTNTAIPTSEIPTATNTATTTLTNTAQPSRTPSATPTPTATLTATAVPSETSTDTLTPTLRPTQGAVAVVPSDTPVPTLTRTRVPTRTPSRTPVPSLTPTASATLTSTATDTSAPSAAPVSTETAALTPSLTPAVFATSAPTKTPTATRTALPTETATAAVTTATRIPTDTPAPTNTARPSLTPVIASSTPLLPTATNTDTPVAAALLPTPPVAPLATVTPPGGTLPPEAIVGGVGLLLVLGYAGFYWLGLRSMERYAGGFVVQPCPVCRRGELHVEMRQERFFGIPRARRIVRCSECRSVLREVGRRRWRYAVDPIENPALYRQYNGREVDETALVNLAQQPPGTPRPPATPPAFIDDDDS